MNTKARPTLDDALAREYPFNVIAHPDGGYVIEFPDLPGCMTQIETLDEVGPMAEEIRILWLETAYEMGNDIPMPSYPEEYSGRFVLRMPKSLHRTLAQAAEREGVSMNAYACQLLAENHALAQVLRRLDDVTAQTAQADVPSMAVARRAIAAAYPSPGFAQRRSGSMRP